MCICIVEEIELQSSSSSGTENTVRDYIDDVPESFNEPGPSDPKKQRRGKKEVITDKLVAVLDKCKISDRDAVPIIIATAEALHHNIDELIINRSSIHRSRQRIRAERSTKLREAFQLTPPVTATVHWDGKMLASVTKTEHTDRLPVIITYDNMEKLLGIPAIPNSSGNEQASAIYNLLQDWDLTDNVQALCCDTTSSNTGRFQEACVLLEQMIGRDLLYLPCRHHIYEIILKSVFEEKLFKSTGPEIPLFKKFRKAWTNIDQLKFKSSTEDSYVSGKLQDIDEKLDFCLYNIEQKQPREDYKEFLELMVVFLRGSHPRGNTFRVPGAFHHVRWMAKAIYTLKIYLFRQEFLLSSSEILEISDICIFLANLYIKAWINAPISVKAPFQDLKFLKNLYSYSAIDENISRIAIRKFCGHLWYLAPENVALSFFDDTIPLDIKKRMIVALKKAKPKDSVKKVSILPENIKHYVEINIDSFISIETKKFFNRYNIPTDFLEKDPSLWANDISYQKGLQIAIHLKVVNDTAERGVKLISEYNNLLTKNEEEKQYILQIIEDYRRYYPNVKKCTLTKIYNEKYIQFNNTPIYYIVLNVFCL